MYNNNVTNNLYIDIDIDFPTKRLLQVMNKFIKPYLLSRYSYEHDIRIRYTMKIIKLLREFKKQNLFFGRKIVCLDLSLIHI